MKEGSGSDLIPITVAYGDGIGPEIMNATLHILREAGARIQPEVIEIGEQVYLRGVDTGIEPSAWDSVRRTRVFLKAPITTPQGGGYKSLNVSMRKALGLYANVRPSIAYAPFVPTLHPTMNVVIVRENEEDLYGGIEHRQTEQVYQCLKLITRPGSTKVIRYAFEYARAYQRKRVTCFVKDNIMKLTDGLFHRVFDEVAAEYPDIESDSWIVDIGAAKLAATPEMFDVIVMPNLYGDILSDVAAQISGSIGLGGSANIGESCAMFEAIHGSAPRMAGQNRANPSGLLLAAVMMLVHIGQGETAAQIHNAWLRTLEDGVHTPDIFQEGASTERVGTSEFAAAVAARLGQMPQVLAPVRYDAAPKIPVAVEPPAVAAMPANRQLVGVDVFLNWEGEGPAALGAALSAVPNTPWSLKVITNRGVKVWPNGFPETFCTDHWRCRFQAAGEAAVRPTDVLALLQQVVAAGFDVIKTENLYTFDGAPGFSAVHG